MREHMFFSAQRPQFFKPLTSKYREQISECLRLFYERLYSANADYGESLRRHQLIEIFEEALTRAPLIEVNHSDAQADNKSSDNNDNDIAPARFKHLREQAGWILNSLIEYGWIEKQVDAVSFQSTYPFSRMGRLFTQTLVEAKQSKVRTRHRNTRNTLNALDAFLARGEVHDLLDAYEYSEHIITDFTEVIAELEECKRDLIREAEVQVLVQQASESFFDFMEKRFQPDLSIKLSADSVEKHRDQIEQSIAKIRRKRKDFKKQAELRLRQVAPELLVSADQSLLWLVLDTIELRMRKAADTMLPALRRALQSFTKRADIIIRQIAYLGGQNNNDILSVCAQLKDKDPSQADQILEKMAAQLSPMSLRLIDPQQLALLEKRPQRKIQTQLSTPEPLNENARRELIIEQLLDQAFALRHEQLSDYLLAQFKDSDNTDMLSKKLNSADLPIHSASDLLSVAHIIELGAVQHGHLDYRFCIEPVGKVNHNDYFAQFDEFTISLEKNNDTNIENNAK